MSRPTVTALAFGWRFKGCSTASADRSHSAAISRCMARDSWSFAAVTMFKQCSAYGA